MKFKELMAKAEEVARIVVGLRAAIEARKNRAKGLA